MTNSEFEEGMQQEIKKRVEYFEENPEACKSKFSKTNYIIAVIVMVVGLTMTVVGAFC